MEETKQLIINIDGEEVTIIKSDYDIKDSKIYLKIVKAIANDINIRRASEQN